jgi:hypothetical protein
LKEKEKTQLRLWESWRVLPLLLHKEQGMFFVPQNYLAFAPIVAKDGPYLTHYPPGRTAQKGR